MKKLLLIFLIFISASAAFAIQRTYVNKESYDTETETPTDFSADYYNQVSMQKTIHELTFDEWFNGPTFFAGWFGLRKGMSDNGIVPAIGYLGNFAANPVGGRNHSATNTSSVHLGLGVDLQKLTGVDELSNWSIGNVWVWRFGDSLTKEYLGNTFNVQQNYGSQTLRLQSLYAIYNNKILDDDFDLTFKFGRFAAGDNFLTKPIYWLYQNNAFDGNPVGIFNQGKWSAYPAGTWAAFAQLKYRDGQYLKAGVYQINSEHADSGTMHGLDWSFVDADGVNANYEIGWDINHDDSGKNPGNISGGMAAEWYNASYVDNSGRNSTFNYTLYLQADYMIWNMGEVKRQGMPHYIQRKGDNYRDLRGVILWSAIEYNPNDEIAKMPFFINGGVLFNAPFPSRPDDVACFGVAYGKFSNQLDAYERDSYEVAMEINYKVQVNRFLFVQPNVQIILNTSGGKYSDALVFGIQYGASF